MGARRPALHLRAVGLLLGCLGAGGCSAAQSALDPRGPAAREIAGLWWLMFWLGLVVYLVVLALLVVVVWRRIRAGSQADGPGRPTGTIGMVLVWGGGVLAPAIILPVLVVASGMVANRVPWNTDPSADSALTIHITGQMFWWEVEYGDQGFETANEIVIPTGEPVHLRLTSTDVIHSFWVPPLHGKIDLTPGHETTITIEASQPGTYRGRCAEYCGLAHAQMGLIVQAYDRPDFEAWLASQSRPAPDDLDDAALAGREVFTSSTCVQCHSVRGHGPIRDFGPDLTHFASRETIAAGTLPNTRGHLGGWILDPQAQKPGNRMPPTALPGEDLQALLDYLAALE